MCEEEPPILLGNSTDAFLKWRSGEPSLLPLSSLLLFPPHFIQLFPHFCFLSHYFSLVWLSPNSLLPSVFSFFALLLYLRVCLSFSQLILSLFFVPLFRVTHYCCADCANITTQPDITDSNKPFPKITSQLVVLLLQSPISLPVCG